MDQNDERAEGSAIADYEMPTEDYATESGKEALGKIDGKDVKESLGVLDEKADSEVFDEKLFIMEYCRLMNKMVAALPNRQSALLDKNFFSLTEDSSKVYAMDFVLRSKGLELKNKVMAEIDERLQKEGIRRETVLSDVRDAIERKKSEGAGSIKMR